MGKDFITFFVNPSDIVKFCETYNTRICYDISHSKLACNYYKWSFTDFTRQVGKYVAHLHIVDAKGTHDEGLQIDAGEIDFKRLGLELRQWVPNASFIPEIWQGHKNNGEGFWLALNKLENYL